MQDVEHYLLHGIQLVLHCVGHMGEAIVLQQYSAIIEFSLMFVPELQTQLLKHLAVIIYIDCVSL
jgi:hypothetical protein